MKAIISCTNDPLYSFFIPIVTYCWNKLGVDVILFVPDKPNDSLWFAMKEINKDGSNRNLSYGFSAPEHKQATYSQTSRLYGACLDLPEDEVLVTGDVDMLFFGGYLKNYPGDIVLFGADLLEGEKMYPMCYCSMSVGTWREIMDIDNKSYQQCLDEKLGHIEAEHFKGNYWCFDQELLYNQIQKSSRPITKYNRAKMPERFARYRVDRDNAYWREDLTPFLEDAHLWRPGYTDENFANILELLHYMYPQDNFDWLISYRNEYLKLL